MSLDELITFVDFTNRFRAIERSLYLRGKETYENDAEHALQLALVAWFLANRYQLPLDSSKLIKMALAHDLVETYAGDTNVYEKNTSIIASKHERESQAFERIQSEFPHFLDLHQIIMEYEMLANEEARFIKSIDKIVPGINIYLDEGRYWKTHGVTLNDMKVRCNEKARTYAGTIPLWEELLNRLEVDEKRLFG